MDRVLRDPLPPGYSGGSDPQKQPGSPKDDREDLSLDDTLPLDVSDAPMPVASGARGGSPGPKIRTFDASSNTE